jgi:hypothetical protein
MKGSVVIGIVVVAVAAVVAAAWAQDRNPVPASASQAQAPFLTPEEKRDRRKNLVVKELNADARGKRRWTDHITVWDENGYKIEESEYAVYGLRERVTYEYDVATGRCVRENVYNDKNRLYRIRRYEYNAEGRKKVQYNYNPDGKLYSTKVYEYSYR